MLIRLSTPRMALVTLIISSICQVLGTDLIQGWISQLPTVVSLGDAGVVLEQT